MTRKQRDNPNERSGLLLVSKEAGITSHDAIDIFRRRAKFRRVGHTGTLDPMATGLLVLCLGKATRLQSYLMATEKIYEGEIRFGWATDSYDATGTKVGDESDARLTADTIRATTTKFTGEIDQVPPSYSAKKVDGVRSYELARKGEAQPLEPRRVTVHEFAILGVEWPRAHFRIRCSPGTYVRSLAHDLGQSLGVPAHLESLVRTATGNFVVGDAMPTTAMREAEPDAIFAEPHFRSMNRIELPMPLVTIDSSQERKLNNGQNLIVKPEVELVQGAQVAAHGIEGELIAICTVQRVIRPDGGPVELQPKVVLS
ncbi:MAG: tRNA pseudouridine(55) synthase TruB [Acidobacteria bacterium]|nr:tRNA pseudouridine(55) synthase TruB [Acidobacteriota bacterium]